MFAAYIKHQKLIPVFCHMAADTINYLQCEFRFQTPDWSGLDKWAHFEKDGETYDIRLTDDCIRPEDGLNLPAGQWKLYLHGDVYADGAVVRRITTEQITVTVHPTGTLNGQPFGELPPSVAEQILARLDALEENSGNTDPGEGEKESVPEAGENTSGTVTLAQIRSLAKENHYTKTEIDAKLTALDEALAEAVGELDSGEVQV